MEDREVVRFGAYRVMVDQFGVYRVEESPDYSDVVLSYEAVNQDWAFAQDEVSSDYMACYRYINNLFPPYSKKD